MLYFNSTNGFIDNLCEVRGRWYLYKYMNMIEKSIAGIDMTAFPCENLYHLIENHSFGCHWNRHLLSFRDENNMVYMPQFILHFQQNAPGIIPT